MSSNRQTDSSSHKEAKKEDPRWIPEGYEIVIGPNAAEYIIPGYIFPAFEQQFNAHIRKTEMRAFQSKGTVHHVDSPVLDTIGEGMINTPTAPGSSDRERLIAHSEVLALQDRLGISYKDAAHRLYMAELEKAKSDQKMYKAFTALEEQTLNTLKMAFEAMKEIEK